MTVTVVVLLVLIVVLMCVPVSERFVTLKIIGGLVGAAIILAAIAYGGFLVYEEGNGIAFAIYALTFGCGLPMSLIVLHEHSENKKIRRGDQAAFDRRVNNLVSLNKYTYEKAIEAVTKIRDGKDGWRKCQ